ncbi:MAG: peptidoglycan editing factor PgeF [Clostridia bacterium]|nr:peptidoglycan editing factor PgeF [Clostridia bacterium]
MEAGLVHGFTHRDGGFSEGPFASLNLGTRMGDSPDNVAKNQKGLEATALAMRGKTAPLHWHRASQVHSAIITEASESTLSANPPEADALITNRPGQCLAVHVADCVPIILFDPHAKALAVIHAGWRGTAGNIAYNAVQAICSKYNAEPRNLLAAIGPSIGPCCYRVGPECAERFPGECVDDSMHLDLWLANKLNLLSAGVFAQNIHIAKSCTACNYDRYFSHRASGGSTGRMAAFGLL